MRQNESRHMWVGAREYEIKTLFEDSKVTFTEYDPDSGPTETVYEGTEQNNGIYKANYTLKAGLNIIEIKGKAKILTKKTNMACPTTCNTVSDHPVEQEVTTYMYAYGVDIAITEPSPVFIDENGYSMNDLKINYTRTPFDYTPSSKYILLYKDGNLVAYLTSSEETVTDMYGTKLASGSGTFLKSFQYDKNNTYEAQVVLNYGSGVEMRSEKKKITITTVTLKITEISTPCESLSTPHTCTDSFIAQRPVNGTRPGDIVTATAEAKQDTTDISGQITWLCGDEPGGVDSGTCLMSSPVISGPTFTFIPNPPAAANGRTGPLSYIVRARINLSGITIETAKAVTQDNLDELRQEYEDMPERDSQARVNFDQDAPAYGGLLGPSAEPSRYPHWHIIRSLNEHAIAANLSYTATYGGNISFTSGYRTPIGTSQLPNSTNNSNHQYGRAFDFNQGNSQGNYNGYLSVRTAGAAADTYLQGSNGQRYYWNGQYIAGVTGPPWPAPQGVTYIQGHAAWE